MKYKIDLAGFEGRKVEVEKKGFKLPCLLIDDIPVEKIGKREMILTRIKASSKKNNPVY